MRSVLLGVLLGVANVLAISLGFSMIGGGEVGEYVRIFGLGPGIIAGAIIGALAHCCRGDKPLLRTLLLALPACFVCFVLGSSFEVPEAIVPACAPSLLAAIVLEHRTRVRPPPPLPVARAL